MTAHSSQPQSPRPPLLQPVKGMRDLIGPEARLFRHIESEASKVAALYGFEEMETPILEPAGLFLRSLGDTSDIVAKEMYRFTDAGGEDLVLRPEGTAGIARAFLSEGLQQHLPLKICYRGPMFRRERPQKGRYRQFYQYGVELLGVDAPQADLEVIACGYRILKTLGVMGSIQLQINTIGDHDSRAAYRTQLVEHLSRNREKLSADSLVRLEKNPLRILDSKDPGDQDLVRSAPALAASLNADSKAFFEQILRGLDALKIPYAVNPRLVRGLDYYCHTVFEFTTDSLGSQNAVLAGGRYDGLIKDLGGPTTPGVGWAFGVDRVAMLLKTSAEIRPPVALVPIGDAANTFALALSETLRDHGLSVELGYSGNLGKRMKRADKLAALAAVIFGDDELSRNLAQVKILASGEQKEVALSELPEFLRGLNAGVES